MKQVKEERGELIDSSENRIREKMKNREPLSRVERLAAIAMGVDISDDDALKNQS